MEYKFYKDKENRDANIYLGIDGTPIPIHYFKNIEIIAGNAYGEKDRPYEGVQIMVSNDLKSIYRLHPSNDAYLTKEDVDKYINGWVKVGNSSDEYSTQTCSSMVEQ